MSEKLLAKIEHLLGDKPVLFKDKINFGIHFHRKTQNMSEWNLQYELEDIYKQHKERKDDGRI